MSEFLIFEVHGRSSPPPVPQSDWLRAGQL
jgi:hypothetical protein